MQVKKVYMDLQEWVKKWNVWKLECDAFKKPIELELTLDDTEIQLFNSHIDDIYKLIEQKDKVINEQQKQIKKLEEKQDHLLEWYMNAMNHITELADQNGEQNDLINELNKKIWNENNTIESMSGTILHQWKKLNQIEQKLTKQPSVFNDKSFISWYEWVVLDSLDIPDGEYLVISKFTVWEHNEYVENKDEILFDKVHVNGGYDIWYQLEWNWTELDTPTATIYYNLVFIPC
mgnify:FL=1